MRKILNTLICTVCLLLVGFTSTAKAAGWTTYTFNNKKYVSLSQVKRFYLFPSMQKSGNNVTLRDRSKKIEFKINSQTCFMNGVKFILSMPIAQSKGKVLLSKTDLEKLLDPVLRPSYISNGRPFTTVIIDPGHGGKDPGAVNKYGTEAGYNLLVAKRLRTHLQRMGLKVVMTRNNDTFISLQGRVSLANQYKNAIFVSIHFNAGGAGRAKGMETFTLSPQGVAHQGRNVKASDHRILRGNHQDSQNIALATAVHSNARLNVKISDRGIKRARYSVLTSIKHPAILLEGGFLSNTQEAIQIDKVSYQDSLARGMAKGIAKYYKALNVRKTR